MDVASIPGLPEGAVDLLREDGIEQLYPPQAEAVERGVTGGRNLVASVPTASGKTLVAQLAMISAIYGSGGDSPATDGGKALYIVPLRALASEKAEEFEALEQLGIDVGISTGNYESSGEWLASKDLIVATSEKVDSLVRNGAPWIEDLSCVVADEVHLVDDAERGPTLEVTLAKLRKLNPGAQVVALSATIDNADEIAEWLDAELVDTDWRPIELRTGVHYGDAVHLDDGSKRELPVGASEKATAAIVRDTLEDDGSTLVFVSSRRNAESAAGRLADTVDPHLEPEEREALAELAEELRDVGDTETSDDLAEAVERGAAFHHAGLASEHRSLIEDAFRDRLVKVVSATPTLAAGVNTPSRRVVVRDWRRYDGTAGGMQPLPVLEVHQMMGRAGRPGRDPYGEALLLAKSHDDLEELQERYVGADPEPVRSKLAAEPALRTHVLATIASGFARSREDLMDFFDGTLYASQSTDASYIESVVDDVVRYLQQNGFVEPTAGTSSDEPSLGDAREDEDDRLSATGLGHTVSRLYLDPMSAAEIVDGLEYAVERAGRGGRSWSGGGGRAASAGGGRTAGAGSQSGSGRQTPADAAGEGGTGFTPASDLFDDDPEAEEDPAENADPEPDADEPNADEVDPADVSITPLGLYHLVSRTPDMYELYLRSGDESEYSELFYEREEELLGPAPSEFEEGRFEDWLAALKTAKLLEDWADEVDEGRITDRYSIGPGDIRSKVDTAEWLLGAAESITSELDLPVGNDVRAARMRVEHGVREELLELVGVRNVGRKRARRLFDAGIETREDLRNADKGVVLAALRGRRKTAETILENAGREDASMEGVDQVSPGEVEGVVPAGSGSGDGTGGSEDEAGEDQSSLGDFS